MTDTIKQTSRERHTMTDSITGIISTAREALSAGSTVYIGDLAHDLNDYRSLKTVAQENLAVNKTALKALFKTINRELSSRQALLAEHNVKHLNKLPRGVRPGTICLIVNLGEQTLSQELSVLLAKFARLGRSAGINVLAFEPVPQLGEPVGASR